MQMLIQVAANRSMVYSWIGIRPVTKLEIFRDSDVLVCSLADRSVGMSTKELVSHELDHPPKCGSVC